MSYPNFTPEQFKIIYDAVKHYQVHGVNFNSKEHKLCTDILDLTRPHRNKHK